MYKTLSPGAVGMKPANLEEALKLAQAGGFGGLEVNPWEIADLVEQDGALHVRRLFGDAGIRPAAFGLPVDWRGDEAKFKADFAKLPRLAEAASRIGITRCATWCLPGSNELPWDAHWRRYLERFTPIAATLRVHGISLGLEFIGPKTLRDTFRYPFVHTMNAMVALASDIGPNVGLLLDCFHWHTAHNTINDLRRLKPEHVVYVHVNDARPNVDTDAQLDNQRGLPAEHGVIDIAGFLSTLKEIGYDGPVTPEPFLKFEDLPDDTARAKKVGASMDEAFRKAGL